MKMLEVRSEILPCPNKGNLILLAWYMDIFFADSSVCYYDCYILLRLDTSLFTFLCILIQF